MPSWLQQYDNATYILNNVSELVREDAISIIVLMIG